MKASATPLPVIKVTQPCHADWESMSGHAQRRFCAHCQRHVVNLSAMDDEEVIDLVCHEAGRLCVRFQPLPDGSVRTLDYQKRSSRATATRRWIVAGLVTSALSAIVGGFRLYEKYSRPMVMGMMVPVSPTPPGGSSSPGASGATPPAPSPSPRAGGG